MLALCASLLLTLSQGATAAGIEVGQPLGQALGTLHSEGLEFIYSTRTITAEMRVLRAPTRTTPLDIAAEILAPHDLGLKIAAPGLYTVVPLEHPTRASVSGRVLDRAGRPLQTARVRLLPLTFVQWSGVDGRFAFVDVEPGRYTLSVEADSYESAAQSVLLAPGTALDLVTTIADRTQPLSEIVVSASRFAYEREGDGFALRGEDVAVQPSLGEDALQSLTRLPGLAFSGISAKPNIRGGEDKETLVLLDGMPIRQAFHMPAYNNVFSVLSEDLLQRAEVFTGGFPARYGNRLSGIIDLTSRSTDQTPRHSLGLSVFNAHARSAGSLGSEVQWLMAGRLGTLRPLLAEFAPDAGRPSYGDLFAKLTWQPDERTSIRAQLLGANDTLSITNSNAGENARLASETRYSWITGSHELAGGVSLEVLIGYSALDTRRSGSLRAGLVVDGSLDDTRRSDVWDLSARIRWPTLRNHALEVGFDGSWGHTLYSYRNQVQFADQIVPLYGRPTELSTGSQLDAYRRSFALYASDRLRLSDSLTLDAGARFEQEQYRSLPARGHVSPRVSLRWDLAPQTRLRASYSRVFQSDEVDELQVEDGLKQFQAAQRADLYVLGWEHRFTSGLAARAEVFRKTLQRARTRYENQLNPLVFLPELAADRIAVSPVDSELHGVELSGHWEQGAWSVNAAYTWSHFADEIDGRDVVRNWDQPHSFALSLTWRQGPWSMAANAQYRSGRPTTPLLRADLSDPALAPRNSDRLGSFASFDFRATREFAVSVGHLVGYLQLTNLLNRRNACCTELELETVDSGRRFLEVSSLNSPPALPAIGISWEF
jgi:outer membrane receptor protein involved in Fe transport